MGDRKVNSEGSASCIERRRLLSTFDGVFFCNFVERCAIVQKISHRNTVGKLSEMVITDLATSFQRLTVIFLSSGTTKASSMAKIGAKSHAIRVRRHAPCFTFLFGTNDCKLQDCSHGHSDKWNHPKLPISIVPNREHVCVRRRLCHPCV